MLVQCPSCAAKYVLSPAQLGAEGRTVRCAKCSHQWHQSPDVDPLSPTEINELLTPSADDEMGKDSPAGIIAAAAAGLGTEDIKPEPEAKPIPAFMQADPGLAAEVKAAESAPIQIQEEAAPAPRQFHAPAIAPKRYQRPSATSWVGFFAFIFLLVGFGGLARSDIVNMWEPSARFYQAVGLPVEVLGQGLEFREVKAEHRLDNGQSVLVVEGQVVNTSTQARDVPALKGIIKTNAQEDVQAWTFAASNNRLLPGDSTLFKTQVTNPKDGGEALSITFTKDNKG